MCDGFPPAQVHRLAQTAAGAGAEVSHLNHLAFGQNGPVRRAGHVADPNFDIVRDEFQGHTSSRPAGADLSLVESAFDELEEVGDDYLDQDLACNGLAACEVLARLQDNFGYRNAYTENVDRWVEAHPLKPTAQILARAVAAIDRILGENSELRELWDESAEIGGKWRNGVEDLRRRLSASA